MIRPPDGVNCGCDGAGGGICYQSVIICKTGSPHFTRAENFIRYTTVKGFLCNHFQDAGGYIGTLQRGQFPKELEYEEQRYRKLWVVAGDVCKIGQLQALVERESACSKPANHWAKHRCADQRYGFPHVRKVP